MPPAGRPPPDPNLVSFRLRSLPVTSLRSEHKFQVTPVRGGAKWRRPRGAAAGAAGWKCSSSRSRDVPASRATALARGSAVCARMLSPAGSQSAGSSRLWSVGQPRPAHVGDGSAGGGRCRARVPPPSTAARTSARWRASSVAMIDAVHSRERREARRAADARERRVKALAAVACADAAFKRSVLASSALSVAAKLSSSSEACSAYAAVAASIAALICWSVCVTAPRPFGPLLLRRRRPAERESLSRRALAFRRRAHAHQPVRRGARLNLALVA